MSAANTSSAADISIAAKTSSAANTSSATKPSSAANISGSIAEFDKATAGTILVCYLSKYSDEEPQLGKVVDSQGDKLIIEWLVGSYSEPWTIWKKKKGKDCVTWTEAISKPAVLFPVTLSKSNRLSTCAILKLKTAYEQKRKM